MSKKIKIDKILNYIERLGEKYDYIGKKDLSVNGFSSLSNYKNGSLTWVKSKKNIPNSFDLSMIELAIVQEEVDLKIPNQIKCKNSKKVFFALLDGLFVECGNNSEPIGKGTYISPEVKIGKNVIIGNNCVIDGDIEIGDNTRIYHNVTIINRVRIGQNCDIESGVNIGHDGYAFTEDDKHEKTMIKHYGGVKIGSNVHIGGQCHIARGTIDDTIIGSGSKLDTFVHIAHNCNIGENCAILSGSVIMGSVILEDNVQITSSIVLNQVKIERKSFIGAGTPILKNVESDIIIMELPTGIRKIKKV